MLLLIFFQRGLVRVAVLDCGIESLCSEFKEDRLSSSANLVYSESSRGVWTTRPVTSIDPHEIMEEILDWLPGLTQLSDEAFSVSIRCIYGFFKIFD